jgi:hypothetical protein
MGLQENAGARKLTELLSGVDALYASSRSAFGADFFSMLIGLKEFAGKDDSFADLNIAEQIFQVSNYSWGRYPVFLEHEFGRIGFTKSENLPGIRLQIRSKYLHAVGPDVALEWFTKLLKEVEIHPAWTLSRLDLFADVQGWNLHHFDEERFSCRASDLTSRKVRNKFSGFEFGRRKTGTINARIYDKTREMEKTPNGWTLAQWGEKYDKELPVWRIEFEFHTTLLREIGIASAEQALARTPEFWAYGTDEWLTFRDQSTDSNKSRWPIAQEWQQIQNASLRGSAVPIERIRKVEEELIIQRLIPGTFGYLTSLGACKGANDYKSMMKVAYDILEEEERAGRRSAKATLIEKKRRYRK